MKEDKRYPSTFDGLLALVGYLRGPDGCHGTESRRRAQ